MFPIFRFLPNFLILEGFIYLPNFLIFGIGDPRGSSGILGDPRGSCPGEGISKDTIGDGNSKGGGTSGILGDPGK